MSRRDTRQETGDDGGPPARRRVGTALALGGAAVVVYELAALVLSAVRGPGGLDRGAVWTIVLMILVTFATIGGIGWGIYRLLRDRGGASDA